MDIWQWVHDITPELRKAGLEKAGGACKKAM